MLKKEMDKAGYTDIATSVGLKMLLKKEMVETFIASDWNGNDYTAIRLTEKGNSWILGNQDQFVFRKNDSSSNESNDDLPF